MVEDMVTTGVDALLALLRSVEKIALVDAASQLHVPIGTVQSWVDFLVEERIMGIEYKFTKPFIYLNQEEPTKKQVKQGPTLLEVKKEYFVRAKKKKIPTQKIPELWRGHMQQELAALQPFFTEQVQRRGIQNTKEVREFWSAYHKELFAKLQE